MRPGAAGWLRLPRTPKILSQPINAPVRRIRDDGLEARWSPSLQLGCFAFDSQLPRGPQCAPLEDNIVSGIACGLFRGVQFEMSGPRSWVRSLIGP